MILSESESDLSEPSNALYFVKGYDSAVTAVITDSEDDLFFLNGECLFYVLKIIHREEGLLLRSLTILVTLRMLSLS